MSTPESVPAGTVSLEDDDPAPVAQPEVVAPAQPETRTTEEAAVDAEIERLDPNGLLAALKAERAEKKALKEKASRVDQLEQYAQQAKPYVDFVNANRHLIQQPQQQAQPQPTQADPELVELAETLSLYTADGQPDVKKAERIAKFTEARAQKQAQQFVQPVARTMAEQRSAQNYHTVLSYIGPNGEKVDQAVLRNLWSQVPADQTANPEVAAYLQMMAIGVSRMAGKPQVVPPPNPPLVTEASGGNPRSAPALTDLQRRVAQQRGMNETKFADLGKGFHPGRTSSLEDE